MAASSDYRRYGSIDGGSKTWSHANNTQHAFGESSELEGSRGRGLRWLAIASVCGLAIGAITAARRTGLSVTPARSGSSTDFDGKPTKTSGPSLLPQTSALAFTALNFYQVRDGKPGQDYPWLKDSKLIEPYRETTLAVTNPREGFEYRWEIREGTSDSAGQAHAASATGVKALIILERLDSHVIVLEEVDTFGNVTARLEEEVFVKYVRREIRSLTDEEREELLDAMYQLWAVRVEDGNGKEMFGENYADIWAINRFHYRGATGHGVCDHFHNGVGFFVSHVLVTNTFEFSLQLVNPKLSLPYWDVTNESLPENRKNYDPNDPKTMSPMFQSSWFGSTDPIDHVVKDGRWAYTEVAMIKENNPAGLATNVYKQLRAPWNVYNTPYMSRGMGQLCELRVEDVSTWPNCEIDYDAVTSFSDYYSWGWNISGNPHGIVHQWVGGAFDCAEMNADIASLLGGVVGRQLAEMVTLIRKEMYCSGMFKCEGTVELDVTPKEVMEEGICGCLGMDFTQGDDYLTVRSSVPDLESYIGDFDPDIQRQVMSLLCSGNTAYGEHTESNAGLDPTFWPIHPRLERIFEFAVLSGSLTDFSWPNTDITITNPDGTTTTEILSSTGFDCLGHRGDDIFPFNLLEGDSSGFDIKTSLLKNPATGNSLTNREVLKELDPRSNGKHYIYDNFKWEHCDTEGISFKDAWESPLAQ